MPLLIINGFSCQCFTSRLTKAILHSGNCCGWLTKLSGMAFSIRLIICRNQNSVLLRWIPARLTRPVHAKADIWVISHLLSKLVLAITIPILGLVAGVARTDL